MNPYHIRGFHVYHMVWTPYTGEQLDCALDNGNSKGPFTVAVQKEGETIGHVLQIEKEATIYRRAVSKYLASSGFLAQKW